MDGRNTLSQRLNQSIGDGAAEASNRHALLDRHDQQRIRGVLQHRFLVQRLYRVNVQDARVDARAG